MANKTAVERDNTLVTITIAKDIKNISLIKAKHELFTGSWYLRGILQPHSALLHHFHSDDEGQQGVGGALCHGKLRKSFVKHPEE